MVLLCSFQAAKEISAPLLLTVQNTCLEGKKIDFWHSFPSSRLSLNISQQRRPGCFWSTFKGSIYTLLLLTAPQNPTDQAPTWHLPQLTVPREKRSTSLGGCACIPCNNQQLQSRCAVGVRNRIIIQITHTAALCTDITWEGDVSFRHMLLFSR